MYLVKQFGKNLPYFGASILAQVLPFVSKDETRWVLQFINVRGPWVEAVDGHRAVRVSKDLLAVEGGLPDGGYSVTKAGKDYLLTPVKEEPGQPFSFPPVDNILPKKWDRQFRHAVGGKPDNGLGSLLYKLARAGCQVNADYAADLPDDDYVVGVAGSLSPVCFRGERFLVVLMPMRGVEGSCKAGAYYGSEPFESGTFERALYPEEEAALEAAKAAALASITPESVAADVDRLNAIFAGPTVPGSKEIDPAHVEAVAAGQVPDPVAAPTASELAQGRAALAEGPDPVAEPAPVPAAGPSWLAAMKGGQP